MAAKQSARGGALWRGLAGRGRPWGIYWRLDATIRRHGKSAVVRTIWIYPDQSQACQCVVFCEAGGDIARCGLPPHPSRTSRIWHGRRDSNPDRTVLETGILPLNYARNFGTG